MRAVSDWLRARFVVALLLTAVVGCGGEKPTSERYIPASDVARAALETTLKAWQNGIPPGKVEGTAPPVQVVDSHRKRGQQLQRYEILSEIPGTGPRCFTVRLHLEDPTEEKTVRFIVLGTDPLWVMRQEDFDMIIHWEHPMDDE